MQPNPKTPLVQYKYDALNRLISSAPLTQDATQRFYLKDHLVTEIQGTLQRSIMQHEDQLLAQQQRQSGNLDTGLIVTDLQRSVLNLLQTNRPNPLAYTPYGHRPLSNGLLSLLGFNGERLDPLTGWYLLGNGYRPFNPVLMRFNSPDRLSPFGKGGFNPYAYCAGDPMNRKDPSGLFFESILTKIGSWIKRGGNKTKFRDNPLNGTYKKRVDPQKSPRTPTNTSRSNSSQRPHHETPPMGSSTNMSPEKFLALFIIQREKTIKTLIKYQTTSTFPGEKEVFSDIIAESVKPLAEVKTQSIQLDTPDASHVRGAPSPEIGLRLFHPNA